ncbi:transport between ER and Golgi ATPase protein, partial [Mortierella sp. AD094]
MLLQDFSSHTHYILVDHQFVFSINFEDDFPGGCLGLSNSQRKWINSSLNKEIDVQPFDPSIDGQEVFLSTLEIGLMVKNNDFRGEFDAKEMARVFISIFNNHVLTTEQALVLDFQEVRLVAIPKKVELIGSDALVNGMRRPDGQKLRGAPRIPSRPSAPISNNGGGAYQPRSSYGAPPEHQYSSQNSFGQPAPRQPPNYQQQQHQPAFQPQPSKRMRAIQSSSERYALTNYVVANPQDFSSHTHYILVDHQFVFSINFEDDFPGGCLGFSKFQRKWINSSLNKEID